MQFVIDASVIGCACRNDYYCSKILDKARQYKICYNKDIFKEYNSVINGNDCKESVYLTSIKEWRTDLINKFGKKTEYAELEKDCLTKLIKRNKFKDKDTKYVQIALQCSNKMIISNDYHFIGSGKKCIESMGVEVFDINQAFDII
jgi:predicted nucleic acid-binding protein